MVLALAMQKGGSGKTTTAAALAQAAEADGKKVLCIDLDPQGNFTFAMGAKTTGTGIMQFLSGSSHYLHIVSPRVDIIPSHEDLQGIFMQPGAALKLEEALLPVKEKYDLVIIDTPPTAGVLQYSALQAADRVIIPTIADAFSLQSLYLIAETIKEVKVSNKRLKVAGVVITQYDRRSVLSRDMKESIEETARDMGIPFLGTIRSGVAVREAAALRKSLFEYAPRSNPAQDYMAIYKQIRG